MCNNFSRSLLVIADFPPLHDQQHHQQSRASAMAFFVVLLPFVVAASIVLIGTRSKQVNYRTEAKHQGRAARDTARREAKRRKEERAPSTPTPVTRARKVSSLETTPPHLKDSRTTPPVAQPKQLRSQGGVFCSHFGKGRHKLYRGYFFCHECDLWDLESPLNPKLKRSSVRYRCKAAHESFIHPTDKRCSKYVPSKNLPLTNEVVMDDHDDDDDDDHTYFMEKAELLVCQERSNGRHSVEAAEKEMMDEEYVGVSCQHDTSHDISHNPVVGSGGGGSGESKFPALDTKEETNEKPALHWRKRKTEANERFMAAVTQALNDVINSHGKRFTDSRNSQLLALVLWNYADGVCQEFLISMAKAWLRRNVFTPWAILREMDIAGGTLSYEGIEVLRRVERWR